MSEGTHKPRVAVIGAGRIGKAHAYQTANHENLCSLIGICRDQGDLALNDVYTWMIQRQAFPKERVEALRDTVKTFTSFTEMIDTVRPDAVIIASPTHLHHQQATYALEAGCHVLCEKPLTWDPLLGTHDNRRQAEDIFNLASRNDKIIAGGSQLAAIVRADLPGIYQAAGQKNVDPNTVTYVKIRMGTASGRGGEELLVDLGDHVLTLLRGICGPGTLNLGVDPQRTQLLPFTEPTKHRLIVAGDYMRQNGTNASVRFHLDATPIDPLLSAKEELVSKRYLEITVGTNDDSYTVQKCDDPGPPYRFGLQSGEQSATVMSVMDPLERCDVSFLHAVRTYDNPGVTMAPIGNQHLLDAVNRMLCAMVQSYRMCRRTGN